MEASSMSSSRSRHAQVHGSGLRTERLREEEIRMAARLGSLNPEVWYGRGERLDVREQRRIGRRETGASGKAACNVAVLLSRSSSMRR
jgi:hypothetical protein